MDSRKLIEAFQDTQNLIRQSPELMQETRRSQAGSRLILPGFEDLLPQEKSREEEVEILDDTTFHCAQQLMRRGERCAVLNFANAYSPGGGVLAGNMAQEECLCRSSNLYEVLTWPYLVRNYYKFNEKNVGQMGTDTLIYSPGIVVLKSDDEIPLLLDLPFRVDVITCAAPRISPERKKKVQPEELERALRARIRNILEAASACGVDLLVLGAFGCGAFANPPETVAEIFHDLLIGKHYADRFRKVVFAIKPDGETHNADIFRSVFFRWS